MIIILVALIGLAIGIILALLLDDGTPVVPCVLLSVIIFLLMQSHSYNNTPTHLVYSTPITVLNKYKNDKGYILTVLDKNGASSTKEFTSYQDVSSLDSGATLYFEEYKGICKIGWDKYESKYVLKPTTAEK